jgi:diguanylate cyclase (GGDEF)-like protein
VNDVVARLGGDEFGLWLDEVGQNDAVTKAVELLEASAVLEDFSGDPDDLLGLSVGIAAFDPESGETLEQLIARADQAMYQAKKTGKASCAVAPPAGAMER